MYYLPTCTCLLPAQKTVSVPAGIVSGCLSADENLAQEDHFHPFVFMFNNWTIVFMITQEGQVGWGFPPQSVHFGVCLVYFIIIIFSPQPV